MNDQRQRGSEHLHHVRYIRHRASWSREDSMSDNDGLTDQAAGMASVPAREKNSLGMLKWRVG